MKTRNVFTLNENMLTVEIVTGNKGDNTLEVLYTQTFDVNDIPETLTNGDGFTTLKGYGLSSLLQDRAASYADKTLADNGIVGRDAVQARADKYQETFDMLTRGVFSERTASEPKGAAVDIFFAKALVELVGSKGKEIDESTATAILQGLSKDERKAMRTKLASAISELKREAQEAASELDLGDLLG